MTAFFTAICQLFAAYLIFKWTVAAVKNWDDKDQRTRLEAEATRARQLSDAVLKQVHATRQEGTSRELQDLLLLDAMNREARAKASLIAVLQEHGCTRQQIDDVIAKIDNQQHAL